MMYNTAIPAVLALLLKLARIGCKRPARACLRATGRWIMHAPSTPFLTRLAVSEDVATALEGVDEALYGAFLNAVAFAENVLPDFLLCLDEAEPLLVMLEDVGLIICFDKTQERYFVTAVIFGDGDSPDPGGPNLTNRRDVRSLVENVLSTSGLPSSTALGKAVTNYRLYVLARSIDLALREALTDAPGLGLRRFADYGNYTGRSSMLRSIDFGGYGVMAQHYLRQRKLPPGHRVDTMLKQPFNWSGRCDVTNGDWTPADNPGPVRPGC